MIWNCGNTLTGEVNLATYATCSLDEKPICDYL